MTDSNADYEIVLNPDDAVFQQFLKFYSDLGWGFFGDTYTASLKSYNPGDLRFYTAVSKDKKEAISSVITGRYPSIEGSIDIVCLGKYFTVPSRRGSGIAQQVWKAALDHPEYKDQNIGLIAAAAMHEKYASKYGFSHYYTSDLEVYWRKIKDLDVSKLAFEAGLEVVNFEEVDYKKVIAFDVAVTGNQRRDTFLKNWMTSEDMLASKVALDRAGNVAGFVGVSPRQGDICITPLFGSSQLVASTLLKAALEEVLSKVDGAGHLRTVVFESNKQAEALFDQLTDKKQFITKLYGQFTKFVPDVKYNQVYCTTELGINVV